jgi:hypothetical protein
MLYRRPAGKCQKASDNNINDKAETPIAERNLKSKKAAICYKDYYASSISSINSDDENGDGQPFNIRGNL